MGGYWESQVGISVSDGFDTPVGNITFKVRTEDSYNNESWSSVYSHDYNGCGY
jgi:hypothetical protein